MWKSDKILCEKREIERDTKKVLTINVYFLFKAKKSKIVGQSSIKKYACQVLSKLTNCHNSF